MRAGIKSSEFWLNAIGLIGGLALSFAGDSQLATIAGIILSSVCGASYTAGRSLVKKSEALGHAHVAASQPVSKAKKS